MIAPLLAYGRWQWRDHLRGAGVVIVLFATMFGVILWRLVELESGQAAAARAALLMALRPLAWPLVILAVAGMVSTDRVEGYNRALFSTPVSPMLFYLQRFLLGGVVVATLPLVLALAVRIGLGAWVDPWREVAAVAWLYLLLGGLVFCWSTFGRRDWAIGLTLYMGQDALHAARAAGTPLPGWLYQLEAWLPPFHLAAIGRPSGDGALQTLLPAGAQALHFLGYAVALIGAGLLVLRVRPMGGGGRG